MRGGKRAGAGRKSYLTSQTQRDRAYETYKRIYNRVEETAGLTPMYSKKIFDSTYRDYLNAQQRGEIRSNAFLTQMIVNDQKELTVKQAKARAQNLKRNLRNIEKKIKRGEPATGFEKAILALFNESKTNKDEKITMRNIYKNKGAYKVIMELAEENDMIDEVVGSH